jgi:ribonuclease P protein component
VLPADRRVRRRDDFTAAVRDGRRVGASGLVVHVRTGDASRPARGGFIVGRAVGTAVVRNRVRRRLRYLLASRLPDLPAGTDVVVRALPSAAFLSRAELAATFGGVLDRAVAPAAP